ncbi:MAG: tyrosine-type recombinase/integrase [Chitinophagaceae bacterium]|nr:tyrosine-type recombinase/integrase [Chitinophagaceae bacterium]
MSSIGLKLVTRTLFQLGKGRQSGKVISRFYNLLIGSFLLQKMKPKNIVLAFSDWFERFIRESASGKRLLPNGKKIRLGTLLQYKMVYQLILEFEQRTGKRLRICLLNRAGLRFLNQEKRYWTHSYKRFSHFLYVEKQYLDNYCTGVFKIVKTFFNYLQAEKSFPVGEFHRKFVVPAERFTPVTLTPAQLRFLIMDQEFESGLPSIMKRAKDIFVLGCTLGLRSHDLLSLKKKNIQRTASGMCIVLHTQKTGAEIKVPLPDYAIKIIRKYTAQSRTYILPRVSGSNLNIQIKRLARLAGWTEPLPKIRHRRGVPVEIKTKDGKGYRFCDHITVHSMRRTAITTLLLMGVDETSVRRISGHAAGSREFYRYVALVQDYFDTAVKSAHQKLIAGPDISA